MKFKAILGFALFGVLLIVMSFLLTMSGPASAEKVVFASKAQVTFVLDLSKKEYEKGEDIVLKFKLVNSGRDPVYVCKRFYMNAENNEPGTCRDVYLIVTSPGGKKLENQHPSQEKGLPRTDHFVLLAPGEEAAIDRDRNIKYFFDFSEIGDYTIKGVYQNVYGDELGLDTFKKKVESEPVVIKIKEKAAE